MIKKLNNTFSSKMLHFPSLKIETNKSDLSRKNSAVSLKEKSNNTSNNNNSSTNTNKKNSLKTSDSIVNDRYFLSNTSIEPDFEYRGYHKFGRVLGKGRFGTVIECVRKCDDKPIALKFFKYNAIYQWIPESSVINDIDEDIKKTSEYFSKQGSVTKL